jgi:hypothetical protein
METTVRIERTHQAFAEPGLPTWLRRHGARRQNRTDFTRKYLYAVGIEPTISRLKIECYPISASRTWLRDYDSNVDNECQKLVAFRVSRSRNGALAAN